MKPERQPICDYCKEHRPDLQKSFGWELQHLHVEEGVIEFLTCDKCKLLSPVKFLEKLDKEGMH